MRDFVSRKSGRVVKTCVDCQPVAVSAGSGPQRVAKRKPSSKSRENEEVEEELNGGRSAKKAKKDEVRRGKEDAARARALLDSLC